MTESERSATSYHSARSDGGSQVVECRFVVIGCPGHGKSTFLNEIAEEKLFKVSPGGEGCTDLETENVRKLEVIEEATEHENGFHEPEIRYILDVVDTPGFPDPNLERAAKFYDHVVEKARQKINGVVFVIKPERLVTDVTKRYEALLREFNYLDVPLVMVVNGTEPPKRRKETQEAFETRRKSGVESLRDTGEKVAKAGHLEPRDILVSFEVEELNAFGKTVARMLREAEAKESNMKTFDELQRELQEMTTEPIKAAQKELDIARRRAQTARDNHEYKQRRLKACQDLMNGKIFDYWEKASPEDRSLYEIIQGLGARLGISNSAEILAKDAEGDLENITAKLAGLEAEIAQLSAGVPDEAKLEEIKGRVETLHKYLVDGVPVNADGAAA